jgi:uncharacterized protein
MQNPKFSIFKSSTSSQYYFRLRTGNGEIILSSESYIQKQSCVNAIAAVKINAVIDARYERKDASLTYRFNLKGANGKIIGTSEIYTSYSGRENGINAVKKDAPYAPVEDLS